LLVIRLARTGRAKYPTYRIVAAESARAATGKFVAILGHYNPHTKELVIKKDEVQSYLGNGAQPSNTVVKLLMREKMELPKWVSLKTKAAKATETEDAPAKAKDGERVAELNEEAASEAESNAPDVDGTDTAATEEATADKPDK
jgi:small subunit ribosomal protein S16